MKFSINTSRVFKKAENIQIDLKPNQRSFSPEIDERIEKIKNKILNKERKNSLLLTEIKNTVSPPKISLKNASDLSQNSVDFESFFRQHTSPEKNSLEIQTFIEIESKKKNLQKIQELTPPKKKTAKKNSPQLVPEKLVKNPENIHKKKNFKENIKKLKEIYYDKSFVERMGGDESNEMILKNSSQKSNKSNNLQVSFNFSESKNLSSPSYENSHQKPSPKIELNEEKNDSYVRKIYFDSELNYSISHQDSPLKNQFIQSDPILKKLNLEAQSLSKELE